MEIDGIHRCVCRQDYGGPNCDELGKTFKILLEMLLTF